MSKKQPMHKIARCIAGLVLLATSSAAMADFVLGVAGPMTGGNAAFGNQYWTGASQAAEDINAMGGINGEKIRLVKADDACDPKQAVAIANRLVDSDKVNAVIGHFCSSSTIPAYNIYDEAGIFAITPGSTNPTITEKGMPAVFRMCGRDDQQGIVGANYITKTLKAKKVAVIHDKDAYGQGLADAMKAELHRLGGKEVLYEGLNRGDKDFNALVTKLKSLNVDAVYYGGCYPEAGPLVRQMRDQGVTAAFLSGDCLMTDDFLTSAGGQKYAEGVMVTFGPDPLKIKAGETIVKKLQAKGLSPEGYTLYAYASLQAIAAAFNGVGSNSDSIKAANWLKSHEVDTVMGKRGFDRKGDSTGDNFVWYRWDASGKYVQQ